MSRTALAESDAEALWELCRNNAGIARLLVHECRPRVLVDTACRMALESGCRAVLETQGRQFEGDLPSVLEGLAVPSELVMALYAAGEAAQRLDATDRVLEWTAGFLRRVSPGRAWSY